MASVKEQTLNLISSLPDDCTIEDIQYHLYVRETVLHRIATMDEQALIPQEQVEEMVEEWLRSDGSQGP